VELPAVRPWGWWPKQPQAQRLMVWVRSQESPQRLQEQLPELERELGPPVVAVRPERPQAGLF